MKTLYVHSYSGIAGDMMLGALVDCGVDFSVLEQELKKLNVSGYQLSSKTVVKNGMAGIKVDVLCEEDHHHRGLSQIKDIIESSELSPWVKEKSVEIFTNLARAEAKIHSSTLDEVHFHEVGAVDAIVDIVGTCIGLELLDKPTIYASPLHVGTGFVSGAHGIMPVPAPATLEILTPRRVPVYSRGIEAEMVTPTGAAIIATLAHEFGPQPQMLVHRIGYGAGTRDLKIPNFVRLVLGEQKKNNFNPNHHQHEHHHHH